MKYVSLLCILLLVLLAAACGELGESPASDAPPQEPDSTAEGFDLDDWDSVEAAARGQTVNWYMWGGSESINAFVETFYGNALQRQYDITLNRVSIDDAVVAVNQVLEEQEAGIDPGSIDLIWINGENFARLKEADMLYGGWTRQMPNSRYVNWDNPTLNRDFGEPIEELESPWSSAQLQFIYDTERMEEDELPRSYAEIKAWACDHPGRFTYIAPGPGAFQGTRFIKGVLYELSGGAEQWATYDEELWEEWSPQLWDYFTEIKPCLWEEGQTYPESVIELHRLFKAGEVNFSLTQVIAGTGPLIVDGQLPPTARPFVLDAYMIGDYNYVAIPANAPNKAAAIVLANLLLEPRFQAAQLLPENGFGLGYGIDVSLVPRAEAEVLRQAEQQLGEYALTAEELAAAMAPDTVPRYQDLVEQEWRENVLEDAP